MDNMERRQNEELLEARRLRRQEQKRKLLMRQRVLAVVLLVIVILSLILILRGCRNRREHPELYAKKDSTLELQTEPDATVNIAAVGDIMITDELLADAKQPDGSYQFAESFAAVSGYTLSADLTIGNLECNFCGEPYAGKPDYRAPESLATTLSTIFCRQPTPAPSRTACPACRAPSTRSRARASTTRVHTRARPSTQRTAASCSRPSAA